jgi:hypothetical protein
MPLQTYHATCDCSKIAYEVQLDFSKGTFKCNCRICWKNRFWGIIASPDTFKLTKGSEADLLQYGQRILHFFCRTCGTQVFGKSADRQRMAIPVSVLDDVSPETLVNSPVRYADGIHDNFKEEPAFKAHL